MGDEEPQVEAWITETQALLQPIIRRPKLTPVLLQKPPFRFLHDIVSELTKVTGFPEGLYDETESVSSNIKDKDSKIAYLQKIIDCVSFALGVKIDIRPNKVVAGMEPEATNVLLQNLARAATDPNVDRQAAVNRVLSGESTAPRPVHRKPPPEPMQPAASPQGQDPAVVAPPPQEAQELPPPPMPAMPLQPGMPASAALAPEPPVGTSAAPLNTFKTEMPSADDPTGGVQKPDRPRTPRRPPPSVPKKTVKVEPTVSKGEVTATQRTIITEGAVVDDEEDDEGIVIVNSVGEIPPSSVQDMLNNSTGEGHTHVVKNILAAQKEMEEAGVRDDGLAGDAADQRGQGIILKKKAGAGAGKDSDRQRTKDEIQRLRADIQALCQATNPLGKSLEYVHEDLEAMSRELEHWRSQHAAHKAKMQEESMETDGGLRQLQQSVDDVDRHILEEKDTIRALKASIIRNDATIAKLLQGVVQ